MDEQSSVEQRSFLIIKGKEIKIKIIVFSESKSCIMGIRNKEIRGIYIWKKENDFVTAW